MLFHFTLTRRIGTYPHSIWRYIASIREKEAYNVTPGFSRLAT